MKRYMPKNLIGVALFCICAAAQTSNLPIECSSPRAILDRYVVALGGEIALRQVQTIIVKARESEPHTFNPASTRHSWYTLKWKAPDKVRARPRYLLSLADWRFDGKAWSIDTGQQSHNNDNQPPWRVKLKSEYPYNDDPPFMMYRITANPIMLATAKDLYASLELGSTDLQSPGTCVLFANGTNEYGARRRDILQFDAQSGLLKLWEIQIGSPRQVSYVRFTFSDYRPVAPIKIPFRIYFDFYQATFRLTKVTLNAPIADEEFVPKR